MAPGCVERDSAESRNDHEVREPHGRCRTVRGGLARSTQNGLRCLPAEASVTWANQGRGEFLATEKTYSGADVLGQDFAHPASGWPGRTFASAGIGPWPRRLLDTFRRECGPPVIAEGLAGLSFATAARGACLVSRARQAGVPRRSAPSSPGCCPAPLRCRALRCRRYVAGGVGRPGIDGPGGVAARGGSERTRQSGRRE
jgi:hypothetical protein